MVLFRVLALSVCLVYSAPSNGYPTHGVGQGGGVGYSDTFRPRFPGVNMQKEDELLFLNSPDHLQPNPDKPAVSVRPIGAEEEPDSTIVHQSEGMDLHPVQKMYDIAGDGYKKSVDIGIVRDVVEKPIVEKTIIMLCDCDKHIEEKHLDEPVEEKHVEDVYIPEESHHDSSVIPANPDLTVYDSKKDLYDVPVNPDFGQPPPDKPEMMPVEPELMMPVEPELTQPQDPNEEPSNNPAVLPEQPVYEPVEPTMMEPIEPLDGSATQDKEGKLPDYDYNMPKAPEDYPSSKPQPELPEEPKETAETPKEETDVPVVPVYVIPPVEQAKEPSYPETPNSENEPKTEYDQEFPKKAVEVPTSSDNGEVYPEAPVDKPVDESVASMPDEAAVNPPEGTSIPDADVKPEPIVPVVVEAEIPSEIPVDKTVAQPAEVPIEPEIEPQEPLIPEIPSESEKPLVPSTGSIGSVCEDLGLRKFLYLLNKAGYKDMLNRKRPLTIFVPSDEAWQRLPLPVLNRLQRDRGFLRRVLRYHMVDGLEQGQNRQDYYCPSMQQGNGVFLNTFEKQMYVNGLPVTASLVRPTNGMVYVIQRVMFPFPARNLAEAIQSTGTFTRFYTLASEAGLLDHELSGTGPYTLFAPTDEAFAKLPPKTVEWLSWDKAALRALLRKHLVSGTHYTSFVPEEKGDHLKALDGADIQIKHTTKPGDFTVNDAHLMAFDLTTRNGVLHAVDEVLFAEDLHPKAFQRPVLKRIYA